MARIHINNVCNVLTDDHSNAYRRADGTVAPEITVPTHRLRLSVRDARELASALTEAVQFAEGLEKRN